MNGIGLTGDHLAALWDSAPRPRYALRLPGLTVLEHEILALVGDRAGALLDELGSRLPDCALVDGPAAARRGVLRVVAQQAVRAGRRALVVRELFPAGLSTSARALAVADLAGLGDLGLTVAVVVDDPVLAALFADRVVIVREGRPVVAYPVLARAPRAPADVAAVTERLTARLASS